MQAPLDFIIVELDKAFQDQIITESGVTLFQDTHLNPEWKTTVTGRVVSAPAKLSKRRELQGLSIEPQKGDRIFFSYMVVFDMELRDNDTPVHHNLFYYQGKFYWKVDYHHFLGIIKDELIPAQGYVFLEKTIEHKDSLSASGIWMPEMTRKTQKKGVGKVLGVGRPKEGSPELSIKKGDTVCFRDQVACEYDVDGKKIWVVQHDYIFGVAHDH